MTKNWSKQFSTRDTLKFEIKRKIKFLVSAKANHNDFMTLYNNLFTSDSMKSLPNYVKEELDGYWNACMDLLVQESVIFMYQWEDNKFYTLSELQSMPDFSHQKLAENMMLCGTAWDKDHLYFVSDHKK